MPKLMGKPVEPVKNNIQCDGEVILLSELKLDPMNARLHPETNLKAIKESLAIYGQRSPLVVRQQDLVIAAGNGRWRAMKELGWTHCAATIRPMTDVEFIGFGLADNRSAELAKWDIEVVARLDRLLEEKNHQARPGWSLADLKILRADVAMPAQQPTRNGTGREYECPECGHHWIGNKEGRPLETGPAEIDE